MGYSLRCLAIVAVVACAGLVRCQDPTAVEPLAPYGWWSTLTTTTQNGATIYCIVRDYPWRGNTQWTPLLCRPDQPYDHQYLFRLTKSNVSLLEQQEVVPGELYDFRIYMYPFSYTTANTGALRTGQRSPVPTRYTVQRVGAAATNASLPAALDLSSEEFHLVAVNGDKKRFCYVKGSGHNALVYCDAAQPTQAAVFKMPYNFVWGVGLVSEAKDARGAPCGGYAIAMNDDYKFVNCTRPTLAPANYKTMFGLGLGVPGAARLVSGMNATFKHYDPLWRYTMNRWQVNKGAPHAVRLVLDEAKASNKVNQTPYQWFTVDKWEGEVGDELESGDVVTLLSTGTGKYCCVRTVPNHRITCDKDDITADDAHCRFAMNLNPVATP